MDQDSKPSLSELEKIYSKKKPMHSSPDDTYDTLHISKSELENYSFTPLQDHRAENQSLLNDNLDPEDNTREAVLETVSLFHKDENLVVDRYDSPITAKRKEIITYKGLAFLNLLLLECYLIINIFKTEILASIDDPKSVWPNPFLESIVILNEGFFGNGFINTLISSLGIVILIPIIFTLMQKTKSRAGRSKFFKILRISFILFTYIMTLGNGIELLTTIISFHASKILYEAIKTTLFVTGLILWRTIRKLVIQEAKMLEKLAKDDPESTNDGLGPENELYDLEGNNEAEDLDDY